MSSAFDKPPVRWTIIAMLITVALITGGASTYMALQYRPIDRQSPTDSPTTDRETIAAVSALGYIEPKEKVIKLSAPAMTQEARVEKLFVRQGDRVKAGQPIAILDSYSRLWAAYREVYTQAHMAQARLAQVKAGAKSGDIEAQEARFRRTIAELEGQIIVHQSLVANLEARYRGEYNTQKATIERIKAESGNARSECQRYQGLFQQGVMSAQDRDRACLLQQTTQEQLKEVQAQLELIVNTMQAQINQAKANQERTIATLQRQIKEERAMFKAVTEVRPIDVRVAQAEVESALAAVEKAKTELTLAQVYSPRDGQILKIHSQPGERVSEQGIVEIGQTQQMYVRAEVYETDITQVHLGQSAIIKGDSLPKDLSGTVEEIGLQVDRQQVIATDPTADVDARVVEVKIRLNPEDSKLVAGLTHLQVNVIINTSMSRQK